MKQAVVRFILANVQGGNDVSQVLRVPEISILQGVATIFETAKGGSRMARVVFGHMKDGPKVPCAIASCRRMSVDSKEI